jgi:hypothetical protein
MVAAYVCNYVFSFLSHQGNYDSNRVVFINVIMYLHTYMHSYCYIKISLLLIFMGYSYCAIVRDMYVDTPKYLDYVMPFKSLFVWLCFTLPR